MFLAKEHKGRMCAQDADPGNVLPFTIKCLHLRHSGNKDDICYIILFTVESICLAQILALPFLSFTVQTCGLVLSRKFKVGCHCRCNDDEFLYLFHPPTGYCCMLFCRLLICFKINFFEKLFQEYHQIC